MVNELERLKEVFQIEATAVSKGDFLLTHAPFERLNISNKETINEDELFRRYLQTNMEQHKFVMIQGGNGSGKSHLIRWLKERYEEEKDSSEAILWISRAHNTLQDALTQLLESDLFTEETRDNTLNKIKTTRGKYTLDEFKKLIAFNFELLTEADSSDEILERDVREQLVKYLHNDFILSKFLMKEGGPLDKIRARIETTNENIVIDGDEPVFLPSDFAITYGDIRRTLKKANDQADAMTIHLAEKFADNYDGEQYRNDVANYLNTKVSEVINRSMDLRSVNFQQIFIELRKNLKCQGKNLTIFIEDINALNGIENTFIEALLVNHMAEGNEGCCRLISIVGSTTWFYEKLNASVRERITENIYLSEGSVLQKGNLAKFAARYINAIKIDKATVNEWVKKGANKELIPVAEDQFQFSKVNIDGKEYSIFPFNETALNNLYGMLVRNNDDDTSRTPRIFLKEILLQILSAWYTYGADFLYQEANFHNLHYQVPMWKDYLYEASNRQLGEDAERRSILLRIWGDGTAEIKDGKIGNVSKEIFDAFEVEWPTDVQEQGLDQGEEIPEPEPKPVPVRSVVENPQLTSMLDKITVWYDKKEPLTVHQDLRDLLCQFILQYFPWELNEVPYVLAEPYFTKKNICIEGQQAAYDLSDKIIELKRDYETQGLLIALAKWKYAGDRSWEFENGLDYLTMAMGWLEKYSDKIVDFVISSKEVATIKEREYYDFVALYLAKRSSVGIDLDSDFLGILRKMLFPQEKKVSHVHQEVWNSFFTICEEICDDKQLSNCIIAHYRKSIGGKRAADTNYYFFDAAKLWNSIENLKKASWIPPIVKENYTETNDMKLLSLRIISEYNEKAEHMVSEERKICKQYLQIAVRNFGDNITKMVISNTIEKMQNYLNFLNQLNILYKSKEFKLLDEDLANDMFEAINKCALLDKEVEREQFISKISEYPMGDAADYFVCLMNFENLLSKEDKEFATKMNSEAQKSIDDYVMSCHGQFNRIQEISTKLGGLHVAN